MPLTLPAVKVRLYPTQLAYLRPGLHRIVGGYRHWRKAGSSWDSYPWGMCSDPRVQDGVLDTEVMNRVLTVSDALHERFYRRSQVAMDYLQIAAAILSVRVTLDMGRYGRLTAAHRPDANQAKRVIRCLERKLKCAKRAFVKAHGSEGVSL